MRREEGEMRALCMYGTCIHMWGKTSRQNSLTCVKSIQTLRNRNGAELREQPRG